MDAYDAGGLTFEIASLFVGPAAVGKMAKGTKLGAKAAEMIQLAKNSTKARFSQMSKNGVQRLTIS
ncbi:hypothetical protein HMPREF1113_0022 [Streptococcus oralis SK10]|uniref:hypothetical protein n=1 Tax=Streptococcus oralis TaxID=1303 RepID=UPI00025835F3|nr:hypothetical protein [Streptococcus oralis]EIC79376.1 hypothetical protein HMPREF1113_0022 [Streptococcus oralis SK10]